MIGIGKNKGQRIGLPQRYQEATNNMNNGK